jgi:hypothetical protein
MTLASGLAAVAQLRAWRARCRVTQAKVDPGCCQLPGRFGAAQPVGVGHRHTAHNGTSGDTGEDGIVTKWYVVSLISP